MGVLLQITKVCCQHVYSFLYLLLQGTSNDQEIPETSSFHNHLCVMYIFRCVHMCVWGHMCVNLSVWIPECFLYWLLPYFIFFPFETGSLTEPGAYWLATHDCLLALVIETIKLNLSFALCLTKWPVSWKPDSTEAEHLGTEKTGHCFLFGVYRQSWCRLFKVIYFN